MKHELFRVLEVSHGQTDFTDVAGSLLDGSITLRSLSITEISDEKSLLILGYDDAPSDEKYKIVTKMIGGVDDNTNDQLEESLEDIAAGLNGVICQDIIITLDNKFGAIFLCHE